MRERLIREALDEYAAHHLTEAADPWPTIRRDVSQRPPKRRDKWRGLLAHRRIAVPALIMLLAFGTAGAAGVARMRQFHQWTPPLAMLERVGQLHAIDQVQTIEGYSVTLRHAYADANVVLLETIVRDPAGQALTNVNLNWHLADERGAVLPNVFDSGTTMVDQGVMGQYASFDAAAVQGVQSTLTLRLTLSVAVYAPPTTQATGNAAATPGAGTTHAIATPMAAPAPVHSISLPTAFVFTVPFVAGVESAPQQTVRAADFPLTLRRVVTTPTEIRATVCYIPPAGTEQDHWIVVADDDGRSIPGGDKRVAAEAETDRSIAAGERCSVLHLSGQTAESRTRELRVKEVSWGPTANETRLTGSWVFRYTLP